MMRGKSATGFADHIDDIVGVFLQRVIHAGRRRRGGTIVIDAQPAADIDVRDIDSHSAQFSVKAGNLLEASLDVADVRYLTAEVEVNELQNVETPRSPQLIDGFHQLSRRQPEL